MAKYSTSELIHVNERESESKSEISSHATLMSVMSGLFYARFLHCSSLYKQASLTKAHAQQEKMGCGRETCKYRKLWEKHNSNPL